MINQHSGQWPCRVGEIYEDDSLTLWGFGDKWRLQQDYVYVKQGWQLTNYNRMMHGKTIGDDSDRWWLRSVMTQIY